MITDDDRFELHRFTQAQATVYDQVRAELATGSKTSHWMWFIFPQLKALGRSGTARYFGIESIEEALGYWKHPVLGARLAECTDLVCAVEGKSAHEIFHSPDDLKFRSCMTLFARAAPDEPRFVRAIEKFYGGRADVRTLELLRAA